MISVDKYFQIFFKVLRKKQLQSHSQETHLSELTYLLLYWCVCVVCVNGRRGRFFSSFFSFYLFSCLNFHVFLCGLRCLFTVQQFVMSDEETEEASKSNPPPATDGLEVRNPLFYVLLKYYLQNNADARSTSDVRRTQMVRSFNLLYFQFAYIRRID